MPLFQKLSPHLSGRAVLLSIKPKYADLILAGSKRVEFRRTWAAQGVDLIILYSSSPVRKIVGIVEVDEVINATHATLWKICTENGGGVRKDELRSYFQGKTYGNAVMLGKVFKLSKLIEPSELITNFVAPQSFRYLNSKECMKLEKRLINERIKR